MANIKDQDAAVFKQAGIPVVEFTDNELEQLSRLAGEVNSILEAATKRHKDTLRKTG